MLPEYTYRYSGAIIVLIVRAAAKTRKSAQLESVRVRPHCIRENTWLRAIGLQKCVDVVV